MRRILFILLLLIPSSLLATERVVTIATDDQDEEGSLRTALRSACDDVGDDTITFADRPNLPGFRILLQAPLVIPADCQGSVTVSGSVEKGTIIDGSLLEEGGHGPGDSCILHVYSDGHAFENLTFVNNDEGAGLCLFGRDNAVRRSFFGRDKNGMEGPNRYGIVISDAFASEFPEMTGSENLIGGLSFENDRNTVEYNDEGGILVVGSEAEKNLITHNIVSKNGGPGPGIDLGGDSVTANDPEDTDEGANHLLNFVDYLQVFPLVPSPAGEARYWSWGIAKFGNRIEMYVVSPEDTEREVVHGGGDAFVADADVQGWTFSVPPGENLQSSEDSMATVLSFDEEGNTSEYARNVPVGADEDLDGILDSQEPGDGTEALEASSSVLTDSDGDGLPDSVEDRNRNGVWEPPLGETSAYRSDSDRDGVNDWAETHGDGIYDAGIDTDPLRADTDGDGLFDGQEDANGNGVWDGYLRESNPLAVDSDEDGFMDATDTCPSVPNPGQEPWYCPSV